MHVEVYGYVQTIDINCTSIVAISTSFLNLQLFVLLLATMGGVAQHLMCVSALQDGLITAAILVCAFTRTECGINVTGLINTEFIFMCWLT